MPSSMLQVFQRVNSTHPEESDTILSNNCWRCLRDPQTSRTKKAWPRTGQSEVEVFEVEASRLSNLGRFRQSRFEDLPKSHQADEFIRPKLPKSHTYV